MRNDNLLSEPESLALYAIIGLGNDADATSIRKRIKERTGRDLSVGAIYAMLDRLEEDKKFITSRPGQATAPRGNREVKFFSVDAAGMRALDEMERAQDRMREGLLIGNMIPTGV